MAKKKEETKRTATQKEMLFMQAINNIPTKPASATEVFKEFNDIDAYSAVSMSLRRKRFVDVTKDDEGRPLFKVTKDGDKALANPLNTVGAPQSLEERYGPRPEGLEPVSKLEALQARVDFYAANLNFQKVDQRLHPFSKVAADKVARAQKKHDELIAKLLELKNAPDKDEKTETQEPDTLETIEEDEENDGQN